MVWLADVRWTGHMRENCTNRFRTPLPAYLTIGLRFPSYLSLLYLILDSNTILLLSLIWFWALQVMHPHTIDSLSSAFVFGGFFPLACPRPYSEHTPFAS